MNDMAVRIEGQLANLSAEKNRLDTILRGMGEGLIVCDAKGVITLVNPAFHALFSVKEQVEGRPLIEISRHPTLHQAFQQVIAAKHEFFAEITLPLAEEKTVLTHWVPLLAKGEIHGVVAVFHDITDLNKLERVRRDFVANVSHELRTPVTVIKGYAETLLGGVLNEDPGQARRFIEIINNHSARMANLINDLLALSELESGGMALELRPVSLHGAFNNVQRLLESKAYQKGITISLASSPEQQRVLADQGKLEQVLVNLVENAIKYTPADGSIAISAVDAGKLLRISITDTGIGIPPKDLPRIFERFYRVDEARSRELGGTGLGLAIVKHIVQLHGGTISVESRPGKGSTFSFTLTRA
jgi:two-component system phosphate regulon sensor histidine kinase PhoR